MNSPQGLILTIAVWFNQIVKWFDKTNGKIEKWLYKKEMKFIGWEEITNEKLSTKIEREMNPCLANIKIRIDQWNRVWCLIAKKD